MKSVTSLTGNNLTGPYAFNLTTKMWVSHDDVNMAVVKSKYALSMGLGGAIIFNIHMDDFNNTCGAGSNPMMKAVYQTMTSSSSNMFHVVSSKIMLSCLSSLGLLLVSY